MTDTPASLEYLKQEKQIVDDLQQQLQPEVPEPITSFLGRLALLYGMPFGNLVPDARMLPPESIRFFYIDRNWVEALVDGAFSIGVHSERDIRYHKVMQHAVREASAAASGALRSDLRGEADLIIKRLSDENDARRLEKALSDLEGVLEAQVTFANKKARVKYVPTIVTQAKLRRAVSSAGFEAVEPPVRAGFLMRSAIVSGWPGLEICGYSTADENDTKLKLLRLERLSPDVLLCIFEDIPKMIVINEPAEDFHFGVTRDDVTGDTVRLRDPATGARLNLTDGQDVIPLHKRGAEGVIDIKNLHEQIRSRLDALEHQMGPGRSNFAVQMIDAADKQAFIAEDGSEA